MKVGVVGYGERVVTLAQLCKKTETELVFWQPEGEPKVRLPRGMKRVSLDEVCECALLFFCA